MQNLGFVFAVMPLIKKRDKTTGEISDFLQRHVQMFNTHPYLSAPILGSVAKAEEDLASNQDAASIVQLKKTLMGPYAAIGDTFFWGTLRPFAAIVAVAAALLGFLWAPVVFIVIYDPVHLWVRWNGFSEGYRLGNQGFKYVQALNLPALNPKIRWLSVAALSLFSVTWFRSAKPVALSGYQDIIICLAMLLLVLLCNWAIRKSISPLFLLYVLSIVLFLISI